MLSNLLPARVNQHVAIVRADPRKASPFYVLDAINSDNRKALLLALAQGGATREALTKDTVSNFEIVLPPRQLMERYDNVARRIHKQCEVLLHSNPKPPPDARPAAAASAVGAGCFARPNRIILSHAI